MKTVLTTEINAPAELVFLWLEDKERLQKWVPNIIEDEPIIETPEKVGSKFRQVYLEQGKRMEMVGEITAYVENERMRVDIVGDMFDLDVDYTLEAMSPTQTALTQTSVIKFKGFMKLFAPFMTLLAKMGKNNAQDKAHQTLKEMAEAEHESN